MAWPSPPRTWSDGETVTAPLLNAQLRDALNIVKVSISDSGLPAWAVASMTTTGTQHNVVIGSASILRCSNASLLTLTGIVAGVNGQLLLIESLGAGQVDLANANVGSSSDNRFINQVTGTISLAAGVGRVLLRYDTSITAGWHVVYHEQGTWILPTFATGNFTGNGSMSWTVAAGDVSALAYRLHGRTMQVAWNIGTSTVGGTLNSNLQIGNGAWGGFTAARTAPGVHSYRDNGAVEVMGRAFVVTSGTVIIIQKINQANWTTATDTTETFGSITFEVQ